MPTVKERIEEINLRLFALEGRITTIEAETKLSTEYRNDQQKTTHEEIKSLKSGVRAIELKLAWYAGGLAALIVAMKIFFNK